MLQTRRIFYEVRLISWVVRHDLLGDKALLKTISERGDGYDRPTMYDELYMDLKVYQKAAEEGGVDTVFEDVTEAEHLMTDKEIITPVIKRVLQSMKKGEISSCCVPPAYVEQNDPEFKTRHTDFKPDQSLFVDVNLKGLCAIQDLYKDKTIFYKSLKKG